MGRFLTLLFLPIILSAHTHALEVTTTPQKAAATTKTSSSSSQLNSNLLKKVLACNAIFKFYAPNEADADANGCYAPPPEPVTTDNSPIDMPEMIRCDLLMPRMPDTHVFFYLRRYNPTLNDRYGYEAIESPNVHMNFDKDGNYLSSYRVHPDYDCVKNRMTLQELKDLGRTWELGY